MERRRLDSPRLRVAAWLIPLGVVAGLVLVLRFGFGFGWAPVLLIPHLAGAAFHLGRRIWKGADDSTSREVRVDVSPHAARVRAENALLELPRIRDLELIGADSLRARTRGHVVTVESRREDGSTVVRVACHPRLLRFSGRKKSTAIVDRIVGAVAPAQTPSPGRRRSRWLDRLLEDPL